MPRTPKGRRQKVAPSLRGFSDARKTKIDLLKDVRTHVVAENAKHGEDHRSKDQIHVSEIVKGACPRMLFYKITDTEPTDGVPGAFSQLIAIWSAGSAEHEKWQRWLREMGDLWGTWTCLLCEYSWEGPVPHACPRCDSDDQNLIRYDEVNLHVDRVNLVGHADGAVPRLESLVEIKSFSAGSVRVENPSMVADHTVKVEGRSIIDHEALWKAVKRPLLSHLLQGLMYLWMCQEMGLPYKKIIFIYENKTTQATKTFEISFSDRRVLPLIDTLTQIKEAAETGRVPPRPKLYAPDAKPCKECPFRSLCWSETGNEVRDGEATEQVSQRSTRSDRRGERRSRQARETERVSPVSRRNRRQVASEERRVREEVPVQERVRDHGRRVRRDGRGAERAVQDLPVAPSERTRFPRRSRSSDG